MSTLLLQPPALQERNAPAITPTHAPVRNRWHHLTHLPRASSAIAAAVGVALSVFPSYLPHDPFTQGFLTTVFVAVLVAVTRRLRPAQTRLTSSAHRMALWCSGATALTALVGHHLIEDRMRAAIGMSSIGADYWARVALAVGATMLLGHICRAVWRHRRRLWRTGLILAVIVAYFSPISPVHAQQTVAVPTASSDRPLEHASPVGAVRVYAEQRTGESARARAQRAVRHLVADGGLRRDHVVLATPTGSGWIDPAAVTGLEQRFGADVAIVGMQYDDLPSWMSYVLHQKDADRAARALFHAVVTRTDRLPTDRRPQLHIYGESLGATAGQSIFTGDGAKAARHKVCSVLWVGTPGDHRVGLPREASVANPDDPVAHTNPSDLWSPRKDGRPWLPVVSFVQRSADLVDALLMPEGHGHKYGPDQIDALQTCR